MTDLLDELRAANPVERDAALPSVALRARALRPRRVRSRHALLPLVFAAAGVLVVLALDRGASPDLAARAYAATGGHGILHWRIDVTDRVGSYPPQRSHSVAWSYGGVSHVLVYEGSRLQSDSRTAGGRSRTWIAGENDYITGRAVHSGAAGEFFSQVADPVATFRAAYREHMLRRISATRFRFAKNGIAYTYEIDPRTALPRQLSITSRSGRPRRASSVVETFAEYRHLPASTANLAKLALLPHPGAGPSRIPAAPHFAVLRGGAAPPQAIQLQLASLTSHVSRFHLVVSAARQLRTGGWLVPGHGWICMAKYSVAVVPGGHAPKGLPPGIAGWGFGCRTIPQVLEDGLGEGSPAAGWTVVVPDGVRALRLRIRGGIRKTIEVRGNVVRVPFSAYRWTFIHG